MRLRLFIAAALLCIGGQASARQIDLSMSDDTAQIRYISPQSYSAYGHTDLELGLLYTEFDDAMVSAGLEMMGEAGSQSPGLHFGVGFKAYALTLDKSNKDIGSITLGVKGWYVPPAMNRFGLVANLNYGPDVTTFGDAERFIYASVHGEFEILPEAAVYVGYRKVRARLEPAHVNVDLDQGWHLGLRMSF